MGESRWRRGSRPPSQAHSEGHPCAEHPHPPRAGRRGHEAVRIQQPCFSTQTQCSQAWPAPQTRAPTERRTGTQPGQEAGSGVSRKGDGEGDPSGHISNTGHTEPSSSSGPALLPAPLGLTGLPPAGNRRVSEPGQGACRRRRRSCRGQRQCRVADAPRAGPGAQSH